MTNVAVPVCVGTTSVGATPTVAWVIWPFEVYASGCVVRVRLAPEGTWRPYEDLRAIDATIHRQPGKEQELITLACAHRELLSTNSLFPTRSVELQTGEPWEHAWTMDYRWPHELWGDRLTLTWPVHELDLVVPVDLAALEAAADDR